MGRPVAAAAGWLIGLSYLGLGLAATVRDRRRWPISPYNMFNRTLPERFAQPRCSLLDGPRWTPLLPVYGLMPLDFFRAVGVLRSVYLESDDRDLRDRFTRLLLEELNERPWRAYDEIRAAHRPTHPDGFSDLRIHQVWVQLTPRGADGEPQDPSLLYAGLGGAG